LHNTDITLLPKTEDIKAVSSIAAKYEKMFSVVWKFNLFCNYNCSYCFPYDRSDVREFFDEEVYIRTVDAIKEQARNNGFNTFHFSFVGGEPTQNPHFLKTLEQVNIRKDGERLSLNLTTNLSKPLSWWETFVASVSNIDSVIVTASYHIDYMRDKKADFAKKLIYLLDHGINAQINIVVAQHLFNDYMDAIDYFKGEGFQVQTVLQLQTNKQPYTEEQLQRIKSHVKHTTVERKVNGAARPTKNPIRHAKLIDGKRYAIEIIDTSDKVHYVEFADKLVPLGLHQYNGLNCGAGFQSIYIQSNGNVQRGVADCRIDILGNIASPDGFSLNKTLTPCVYSKCGGGDLRAYKENVNESLSIYPVQ
jgi:sulfatase maturation enzyme AslB (radical SAM superfamily)